MCGIVGYIGSKNAVTVVLDGLARLEYRGYDSSGIAILSQNGTEVFRRVGRVAALAASLPRSLTGHSGIGHTRWATHGKATEANAHPHTDGSGRIAVVHNGIIDNSGSLRQRLIADGASFASDTDTEVLAHLIAALSGESLEDAVAEALTQVVGTYAIAVMDRDHRDRIVVARNGSPLMLGIGLDELFIASDASALIRHTSSVVFLDDGEFATVTAEGFETFAWNRVRTVKKITRIDVDLQEAELRGHSDYMHKEIFEQPTTIERMLHGRLDDTQGTARLDGLNLSPRELRAFRRVKIFGCGSAYYAGQIGAGMIEAIARIPADAEAASEFRYRNPVIEPDTLYVAVSQSGETADTAFAVQEVKRKGGYVIGLVNVVGSTVARECNGELYLDAGPEISVASTKAVTHTSIGFALLALVLGRVHDLSSSDGQRIVSALRRLPSDVAAILEGEPDIAEIAKSLATSESLFFLGRVRGFPVAREGAQKFKEITYRHAEAYQTSELKHGPLALVDDSFPSVMVIPDDELTARNLAAVEQIAARRGQVTLITHDTVNVADLTIPKIVVPKSEPELDAILLTIPVQLLAYHAALSLGLDVDRPRNLAKSVTVE